ncbi:MAG: hypothetical protein ACRDJ3_00015 [Solirubrobacteraceae bacterium]
MALEPGVHVDPGSPAAKEYALPLNQARQTGQGSAARGGSSGGLFGAGISPASSRAGSSRVVGHEDGSGPVGDAGVRGRRTPTPFTPPATAPRTPARQGSSRGNAGSSVALLGGGVLVLVLGAFLGVVLRGRRTTAHLS